MLISSPGKLALCAAMPAGVLYPGAAEMLAAGISGAMSSFKSGKFSKNSRFIVHVLISRMCLSNVSENEYRLVVGSTLYVSPIAYGQDKRKHDAKYSKNRSVSMWQSETTRRSRRPGLSCAADLLVQSVWDHAL